MACSFFPALFTSLLRVVVIRRDQRFRVLKGEARRREVCVVCVPWLGPGGGGFFVLRGCLGDEEVRFDLFITDLFRGGRLPMSLVRSLVFCGIQLASLFSLRMFIF